MALAPGSTFLISDDPGSHGSKHLGIVVSDPALDCEQIIIATVSTFRPGITVDVSCLLRKGDHPFIKHKSVIAYRHTKALSVHKIRKLREQNEIIRKQRLDRAVLARVREGFKVSDEVPEKFLNVLRWQDLI